jgi:glucose-1-phosphate adenylyltransferase
MMGADHYEEMSHETSPEGTPPMGVGRGTYIKNAIIDKNARIGSNVRITNKDNETERHDEQYSIVDGIVVVSKNAVIPDGTII